MLQFCTLTNLMLSICLLFVLQTVLYCFYEMFPYC
uniref:Uncharacterized protein n=1 Tax=Anguilla anguilla TaxID=7936 RepID=A0A0E9Q4Z7_ANGAN